MDNMIEACQRICEMEKLTIRSGMYWGTVRLRGFCVLWEMTEVDKKDWTCKELFRENPIYLGERKSLLKHFLQYYPKDEG